MNKKLSDILKDLVINGVSDSLAILAYFSLSELLKGETTIIIAENALKLGVILFAASTTSSLYKNLIGEKVEEHAMRNLLAHLVNIPITDAMVTIAVALVMEWLPPKLTTPQVEHTIVSAPFFMTMLANYTGRGVAHAVNHAKNTTGITARFISSTSAIVPTVACNLLYFARFGKDGKDAISEVAALTTANVVSHILNYGYERWQNSKRQDNVIDYSDRIPLLGG